MGLTQNLVMLLLLSPQPSLCPCMVAVWTTIKTIWMASATAIHMVFMLLLTRYFLQANAKIPDAELRIRIVGHNTIDGIDIS